MYSFGTDTEDGEIKVGEDKRTKSINKWNNQEEKETGDNNERDNHNNPVVECTMPKGIGQP